MKVILRKDSEKLGHVSEVNLSQRWIRAQLSHTSRHRIRSYRWKSSPIRRREQTTISAGLIKEHGQAEALAAKLEKVSITIKMKVGEEGKAFLVLLLLK